ncbi:oligosaccharyltransferase complex subunit gamma [Blastomyces parvus]|uniref:Oligosaccharyltransferase complex subunit gamma n=1 Tax=Blastomyces parvus TaxID=2060905 RepID=A0A2B7WGF5_9EURO|nr:oligosaccharyltransferase complex subunit gamma [Blastomyces parvus]
MRAVSIFTALICLIISLSAAKSTVDKYKKYQALSKSSTPIQLDDSTYGDLTSSPRDYHVAIILTAGDAKYGCHLCREVQPEWDLLARSWTKGAQQDSPRLLFGTLDFSRGRNTFQKLLLQSAPVLMFFPPTVGAGAKADASPVRYDFNGPLSADQISNWMGRYLPEGHRPPVVRPINYARIVTITTLLLGAITLFTVSSRFILPIIQNRNLWAAVSLIAILLFTSGHMFNHIRKVPYVTGDGKGGITYFAAGFSSQFGLETQIVAALYATLSFATIVLAMKTPRIADPKSQKVNVIVWGAVIFVMYSFLLSVFRIKNGGYPFFLPPF